MPPAVLLIGLDAADASLARAWAYEGRLPALERLFQSGRGVPIENPAGLYTGAVWTSFATATTVGEHGRYYYRQFARQTYRAPRMLPDELGAEPFWMKASRAGKRVAVVDVPKAPLSRELNGVQVCDWGSHDAEGSPRSHPEELARDLERRFGGDPVGACDLTGIEPGEIALLRDRLLERIRRRAAMVEHLWHREAWDLFLVAFSESHCGGHRFWHLNDPAHPNFRAADVERIGNPLLDVYRELDQTVARLTDMAGPEVTTAVYLSHGMGAHYDGTHLLDEVLRRLEGRGSAAGPVLGVAGAARRLWHRTPRSIHRRGQRVADEVFEWARARDRRRRRAFIVPTNDNCAGIRLNLVGREADGVVPARDRSCVLEEIERRIRELVDVSTGRPVVRQVVDGQKAFPGKKSAELPDLLVQWHRDHPILAVESPRLGRIDGEVGDVRTGDHRSPGLLLVDTAAGPGLDVPSSLRVDQVGLEIDRWLRVEANAPQREKEAAWALG